MAFFLRAAWHEFRAGLKGGVLPLIYIVLTAYILVVMTSADNLRNMGAVDIPRNAPALVYLMTAGDAFFLFFAWAWVFAQPIIRDRAAQLHELVFAAPISLHQLLAARYVGALGVALLLGTSQILGFLLAPVLEAIGAVPPGSVAPAPWFAFGWAALIFTLPLAAGAGALYFIAAMKTRSVGGSFAVAALLMAFWMVAMIVFKGGHADPFLVTVLDPSGFAEAEHQVVDHWTPHEKSTALLALSPALLWNRLLWGCLPLLILYIFIRQATREALLHGKGEKNPGSSRGNREKSKFSPEIPLPGPIAGSSWWRAAVAEAGWQARRIVMRRSLWLTIALLSLLAVAAAFVHGVQHAYGPMVARAEFISPVLTKTFYLIVVFMTAAMVGMTARRDEQPGLSEMFDATPAPNSVRLAGRAVAALVVGIVCVAIPALGTIIVGLLSTPNAAIVLLIIHQMSVLLPAILELAAITLLLHALIRHPGTAHAASILAAFIMVVNFEVGLVNYPPLQIGRGVGIALSGLTGFSPWTEKILASDLFKLALFCILVALSAIVAQRGTDDNWRIRLAQWRKNLFSGPGLAVAAGIAALAADSVWLHQHYVVEGGYESREAKLHRDADWEQRWLAEAGSFSVAGGKVVLRVLPKEGALHGTWQLDELHASGSTLHAAVPNGFTLLSARVDGQKVNALVANDHLAIPLTDCHTKACRIELEWRLATTGWAVVGDGVLAQPSWLVGDAFWLRARDVMPRLGLDSNRVVRTPADRLRLGLPAEPVLPPAAGSLAAGAAAPAGKWLWQVDRVDGIRNTTVASGRIVGLLDFAAVSATTAQETSIDGLSIRHDPQRQADARAVAEDLSSMRRCVAERLGGAPVVTGVAQWPRGLPTGDGDAALADGLLLLAEEPHWDVAAKGNGRLARRADIAAALARRQIVDGADLREAAGSQWLEFGLSGAIGLLCVAEADGIEALQALLARGAQRTTEALASTEVPVTRLTLARRDEWANDYAPLASLPWAIQLNPESTLKMLLAVREKGDVPNGLQITTGKAVAELWLGPPHAVDLHVLGDKVTGESWIWRDGGWQQSDGQSHARRLQCDEQGHLRWQALAQPDAMPSLYLSDWPAFEREPKDNLHATH